MNPRRLIHHEQDLLDPFIAQRGNLYRNPISGQTAEPGHELFSWIDDLYCDRCAIPDLATPVRDALRAAGWLIPHTPDWDRRHRLVYVSLEANTLCNQACYFCPVSIAPRPMHQMPIELYRRIAHQLTDYRDSLQAVFMHNYNEPTADRAFIDQTRILIEHGLPPAMNTNASGLTPKRVDQLLELGGLVYLSINLSTMDRERYARDRGVDLLPRVLANLDYAADKPIAPRMQIAVLGHQDDTHQRDLEQISERFKDTRFNVMPFTIMDRAQHLNVGQRVSTLHTQLRGCDQTGSRPIEHLHINAQGRCVLCSQDYYEANMLGDLNHQSIAEVLAGEAFARQRRIIYGFEPAPDDHICRRCVFACHA